MIRTARRLAAAAAFSLGLAAPFAFTGCNDKCPSEVAKVNTPPTCPLLAANADVTVTLPLCTSCNQTAPECTVVPPTSLPGDVAFQLDAVVQACTSSSSCPLGCDNPAPTVTCRFHSPSDTAVTYEFVLVGPDGNEVTPRPTFRVGATSVTTCGI